MGWFQDSKRHSLAAQGVATGHKGSQPSGMNAKPLHPLEKMVRDAISGKQQEQDQDPEFEKARLELDSEGKLSPEDVATMQREFREAQDLKRRGLI